MVTVANYGLPFEKVLRETAKETYLIHREVQDINRRLISDGYEATATIADIALNTDNPAQTTPEEKNTLPSPQG
jgi:hypothetical protein